MRLNYNKVRNTRKNVTVNRLLSLGTLGCLPDHQHVTHITSLLLYPIVLWKTNIFISLRWRRQIAAVPVCRRTPWLRVVLVVTASTVLGLGLLRVFVVVVAVLLLQQSADVRQPFFYGLPSPPLSLLLILSDYLGLEIEIDV